MTIYNIDHRTGDPVQLGIMVMSDKSSGCLGLRPLILTNIGTHRKWIDNKIAKLMSTHGSDVTCNCLGF